MISTRGDAKVRNAGYFKADGGAILSRHRTAGAGQAADRLPGAEPAMPWRRILLGAGLTRGLEGERCIAHEDTATGFG